VKERKENDKKLTKKNGRELPERMVRRE